MSTLLQIAYNQNKQLVSIYEVPTGKNCNCICPECGEPLEAKNKDKSETTVLEKYQKTAHFSHISNKDCKYAPETALHKLAKDILQETKMLAVPSYFQWGVQLFEPKIYTFETALSEERIQKGENIIVADVLLQAKDTFLIIEFLKTHQVDRYKKEKIVQIGYSAIEIDLNSIEIINNGKINRADLTELITKSFDNKEWIHNIKGMEILRKKAAAAEKEIVQKEAIENQKKQADSIEKSEKRLRLEKWKSDLLTEGYVKLKVYESSFYDKGSYSREYFKTVYCPIRPKEKNKIDLDDCKKCEFHKSIYYDDLNNKEVLCGHKLSKAQ
ncbi:MAG: hypothetical protein V4565_09060 [Bacteroidota bacterium]